MMTRRVLLTIVGACASLLVRVATGADNCIAGGAGYARAFDRSRNDVVSMMWESLPPDDITIELWAMPTGELVVWQVRHPENWAYIS